MKQIYFNPKNAKYYSEDFIKGFECGAKRQYDADKQEENSKNEDKTLDKK